MTASGAFRCCSCALPESQRQSPFSVLNTFLLLNNLRLTDTELGEGKKSRKMVRTAETHRSHSEAKLM
ncbi:hypothetical protein PDJAM_G00067230 [Pangasius djambal]|uniref:Uncharacterized protein n=1 Tax=Pangasius djambal TaxID=1691987 RepID=A0ACC5Z1G6_9TELE|nr:hypothetical protein [Pangasius djambal]